MLLNIWSKTLAMLGKIMYCTGVLRVPHVAMKNMTRITRVNSSNASAPLQ